jgi:Phage tail tube protein
MTAAASLGVATQTSFAASGTAVGSYAAAYDVVSNTMTKKNSILDASGLRGTRQHSKERTAIGINHVGGQVVFEPGAAMLDLMLPRILGGALSANNVPFAETLPTFDVLVDKVAQRHVYAGCYVNKATFDCKPNQKLKLSVDILGKTETLSATAFPAISNTTEAPWVFSQGVITCISVVRQITELQVVVDNHLDARFTNSVDATDISATDQTVTLVFKAPYTSDTTDMYNQGVTGTAGTVVFTNGSNVLTFTFGALQYEDDGPVVSGRGEIFLPIKATARKTGSTAALNFTITP